MSHLQVSEDWVTTLFQATLAFSVSDDGAENWNAATFLGKFFEFDKRCGDRSPLRYPKYCELLTAAIREPDADGLCRAEIIEQLQTYETPPAWISDKFKTALEACLDDENAEVIFNTVELCRQWGWSQVRFHESLMLAVERAETIHGDNMHEFGEAVGASLRESGMTGSDVVRIGELLLHRPYLATYVAGTVLRELGSAAVAAEHCVHRMIAGDIDSEIDPHYRACLEELGGEILQAMGVQQGSPEHAHA